MSNKEAALKYYYKNKEKCKARNKKWRERNKDRILQKQRELKRKRKLRAIRYLGGRCMDCGLNFHPAVYELHHKNPEEKIKDPSKMFSLKWETVQKELNKCLLLCANCHRLRHHKGEWIIEE